MIRANFAVRIRWVYPEAEDVEIVLVRHSLESKQRSGDGRSQVEQLEYSIGTEPLTSMGLWTF